MHKKLGFGIAALALSLAAAVPAKASLIGDPIVCSAINTVAGFPPADLYDPADVGALATKGPNVVVQGVASDCVYNSPEVDVIGNFIDQADGDGQLNLLIKSDAFGAGTIEVGDIAFSFTDLNWVGAPDMEIVAVNLLGSSFPNGISGLSFTGTSLSFTVLNFDISQSQSFAAFIELVKGPSFNLPPSTIPLPATLPLLAFALAGVGYVARRRKAG